MDLGITGKRALVLASSRGLGLGIAEALAAEGASVLLCARSEDKLAAAARAINERAGGRADYTVVDLSSPGAARLLFETAVERLGGVDILINNSGGPPAGPITHPDPESWQSQFNSMVLPFFELTNLCLPGMREARWGRIVTVGSSGVQQPIPNLGVSNALRSALVGWSKTLANEVAGDGITVNLVIPGRIDTERVSEMDAAAAKRLGKSIDEIAAASRSTIPAGRYGTVAEFAAVAAFLASDNASYVTGSVVRCDGGAIRSV